MKKVFTIILVCFAALSVNAQIFSQIIHVDKFDDFIKQEEHKTLITENDSTFIIEEKGREPKVYIKLIINEGNTKGSKDNVVNLANNIYGYQKTWSVIRYEDKDKFFNIFDKDLKDEEDYKTLLNYWLHLTHRVISRYKYSFEYDGEIIWVENESPNKDLLGKDVKRIIYTNLNY